MVAVRSVGGVREAVEGRGGNADEGDREGEGAEENARAKGVGIGGVESEAADEEDEDVPVTKKLTRWLLPVWLGVAALGGRQDFGAANFKKHVPESGAKV